MTMEKRKIDVTQDEELFVWNAKMISTSTKKTIEVHDLLRMIEDDSKKNGEIRSPKFKLAGVDFSIVLFPEDCPDAGFIGVYLSNHSREDQTTSITVKEVSGVEQSWEMKKVPAGDGRGFLKFLSHENYREWAKDHRDVLKLDVVVTLHSKAEGDCWTRTKIMEPNIQVTFASFGKMILEDDFTTDFSIRCPTKEFRVHRNILCARSEVFRANIQTPMQEAAKGEIFIKDVGEKTLGTVINFIYTGELELGEDPDIVELSWIGTQYLLQGFMDLLALQVMKLDLSVEMTADLLIAAQRHEAEDLKKIALGKIRGNWGIFNDPEFRKVMEAYPVILLDLFNDL